MMIAFFIDEIVLLKYVFKTVYLIKLLQVHYYFKSDS